MKIQSRAKGPRLAIAALVDGFYNVQRMQSPIGYMNPVDSNFVSPRARRAATRLYLGSREPMTEYQWAAMNWYPVLFG